MNKIKTFQDENNDLLKSVLENGFYTDFRKENKNNSQLGIEFYVTPDCNQTCSYCYLCKYKDELYPEPLRDEKTIINNLRIFLDYCLDNKLNPKRFDLFGGEIWGFDFGNKILDVVLEAVEKGFSPTLILIPSNFSFLLSKSATDKMEEYIEKFKKFSKVMFKLSCSNDGFYLDTLNRPLNDNYQTTPEIEKGSEEYYEILFKFCKKHSFAFHPMVSAFGIEKWIDNYKWWLDNLIKYEFDPTVYGMYLEVRDNNWTDDKIIEYLKYLNFSIDYITDKVYKRNYPNDYKEKMIEYIVGRNQGTKMGHYRPYHVSGRSPSFISCSLPNSLVIRAGDLAIVPCHRMSYEEFIIGRYIIEDNKIVDVQAKNIQMMNQCWLSNTIGSPKCSYCDYKNYCIKGCFGSQYESNKDFLYPCDSVCELMKAKNIFLCEKFKALNYIEHDYMKHYKKFYENIKDKKEYEKWYAIIMEHKILA